MDIQTQYTNSLFLDLLIDRKHEMLSFREKCLRSIRSESLRQDSKLMFEYILGDVVPSQPMASNAAIRLKLMELLIHGLAQKYDQAMDDKRDKGVTGFYHVTILDDQWTTDDLNAVFKLGDLYNRVTSALGSVFDGYIGWIEIQAFSNVRFPGGGRLLSAHPHIVGWTREPLNERPVHQLDRKFWASDLASGEFKSLEAVKIQRIKPTLTDIGRVATYPLKAPCKTKTLYVSKDGTKANLHQSEADDRFVLYMRLAEILSMLSVFDLIMDEGEGTEICNKATDQLVSWIELQYRSPENPLPYIEEFWPEFRRKSHTTRFKKPKILWA